MDSCPALCLSELDAKHLGGKRVLLRCDLNVPILPANGSITDDTRLREACASIKYLTNNNARVLLCSHLVRNTLLRCWLCRRLNQQARM